MITQSGGKGKQMKELNYKEMWNKLKKRIEVVYNDTKEFNPRWSLTESIGAAIINADCKRWLNAMSFIEKSDWECTMCHKHIKDGEVHIYCKDCQQKIKTGAFDE